MQVIPRVMEKWIDEKHYMLYVVDGEHLRAIQRLVGVYGRLSDPSPTSRTGYSMFFAIIPNYA